MTDQRITEFLAQKAPADSRQARQLARRQTIAEAVMTEGSMRIEDIAERFDISLMTAHRDLDDLAERGLVRKLRGLVSAEATSLVEAGGTFRARHRSSEKGAIARAAAGMIEPGQALFLDDSTTTAQIVPHLAERLPLTVITNSLTLMNALKGTRDLQLIALGGTYHDWCDAFLGRGTAQEIARLRADTFFMSMAAITDGMVFHQSAPMVETKRAMFEAARRRVLLADASKFERRALHAMGTLEEFDAIVVDDGIPPARLGDLRGLDIEVIVAGAS